MAKPSLETQINKFLQIWDCDQMQAFLRDIQPLFELYDVDEHDDWVKQEVGEEDERNVRLVRTVYLVSRIAEVHAGRLASIKMNFKDIWKDIEGKQR